MKFPLSETISNLSLLTFVVEKMKVDVLMMDFGEAIETIYIDKIVDDESKI